MMEGVGRTLQGALMGHGPIMELGVGLKVFSFFFPLVVVVGGGGGGLPRLPFSGPISLFASLPPPPPPPHPPDPGVH